MNLFHQDLFNTESLGISSKNHGVCFYMDYTYLDPFSYDHDSLSFLGAWCFSKNHRHLLIGKNGNIIILNDNLRNQIKKQDIGDELWFKLIQRGLARHSNSIASQVNKNEFAPTFFMIEMTNGCNMRCHYCSRESFDSTGLRTISDNVLESICLFIIRYCKNNKISNIAVQPWGGEPLLQLEKIFKIQDILQSAGIKVSIDIETNGTLLTEKTVSDLHKRSISYGISLDGFCKINDLQRRFLDGSGTYNRILKGIEFTKKYYGDNISILTTLTKQSIPYTGEILRFFGEDLGVHKVKMNYVQQSPFTNESDYCVNESDVKKGVTSLFTELINLNIRDIDIMEYNVWLRMVNILTNRERDICLSRGCCGGKDMITFDTEGNFFPCDVTDYPEEKIGDIWSVSDLVEALVKASNENSYFTPKKSNSCVNCPWEHFCKGGCTMRAKCAGSTIGEIDRVDCAINKTLYPMIVELILDNPLLVTRMVKQ